MSKGIEVYIERCLVIDDYTYNAGRKGVTNRAPEDCYPDEPEELMDITGHWEDTGEKLTDKEFEAHQDAIEEELLEHIHAAQEADDEPRDD